VKRKKKTKKSESLKLLGVLQINSPRKKESLGDVQAVGWLTFGLLEGALLVKI
jgi:hypothetical protein